MTVHISIDKVSIEASGSVDKMTGGNTKLVTRCEANDVTVMMIHSITLAFHEID